MGAAATVSKDDNDAVGETKAASLPKSEGRNRTTTAVIICSSCRVPLNFFKRKVGLIFCYSPEISCVLVSLCFLKSSFSIPVIDYFDKLMYNQCRLSQTKPT